MFRFAVVALCAFALASTARADVYDLSFVGYEPSDPTAVFGDSGFDFTIDTDQLTNKSFDPESGFSCGGPSGHDCFADASENIVFRDGNIDFTADNGSPSAVIGVSLGFNGDTSPFYLFTGPDSDPHLRTGTFDSEVYFNYNDFDGLTTIADTTTSPVPEPSSLALMVTGILGGVAAMRRRFIR